MTQEELNQELFKAITKNQVDLEAAKQLLNKGAEVNANDEYGNTPLHIAAFKADLEVVRLFLHRGANIKAKDSNGNTALHSASNRGHLKVVEVLLAKGAEIEAKDSNGNTPLHFASMCGRLKVAGLLLDKGAEVNANDKYENTPLHYACSQGNSEVVSLLLDKNGKIEAKNEGESTPLHFAASKGNLLILELLVKCRADVTARDKDGNTALHFAAIEGNSNVINLFLAKNPDIDDVNKNLETPVQLALDRKHIDTALLLINHSKVKLSSLHAELLVNKALYRKTSKEQKTEILDAVLNKLGKPAFEKRFLETYKKYRVNELNEIIALFEKIQVNNNTALHLAAIKDNSNVINLFLAKNPDIDDVNKKLKTPVQLALDKKHIDTALLLINHSKMKLSSLHAELLVNKALYRKTSKEQRIEILDVVLNKLGEPAFKKRFPETYKQYRVNEVNKINIALFETIQEKGVHGFVQILKENEEALFGENKQKGEESQENLNKRSKR